MVEVRHLSKKFAKKQVIDDISFVFNKGVYGLLGPNGAGKTTWIRCMLKLYSYKGEVLFDRNDSAKGDISVGYLPQKNGVFPGLTVEEHLEYFANLKHMQKDKISEEIDRALELVNLSDYRKKKGSKLSGGMIRRLGIAQALLGKPDMIIFDEPTTGLDPEERMRFKNIVKQAGEDSAVIMSTHIVEDVEAVCSRIIIMKEGKIFADGTQEKISHLAEGKVFVLPKTQQKKSQYVEREMLVNGVESVRILTSDPVEDTALPVQPTIEDGYLCVLKEI